MVRFERRGAYDGSEGLRIEGTVHAGPSLVGPPARLHGGLHSAVRLLLPLSRLIGAETVARTPLALDLIMRRAIGLGVDVPFEGRFHQGEEGAFLLSTRFDGSERLDGTCRSVPSVIDETARDRFRESLRDDLAVPEEAFIRARGSVPTRVGTRLVSMLLDADFFAVPGLDFAPYVRQDGALDAVFAAVALDVAAACVLGFAIKGRVFTTRFELRVHGAPHRDEGPYRILADRRSTEVEGSSIARVEVAGRSVGETRVEVLFADASLDRVFAHGFVSLVPVKVG